MKGIPTDSRYPQQCHLNLVFTYLHTFKDGGSTFSFKRPEVHGAFHVASPEDLRRGVMFFGVALA